MIKALLEEIGVKDKRTKRIESAITKEEVKNLYSSVKLEDFLKIEKYDKEEKWFLTKGILLSSFKERYASILSLILGSAYSVICMIVFSGRYGAANIDFSISYIRFSDTPVSTGTSKILAT